MKKITLAFMVSLILMAVPVSLGFAWDQAQSEFDAIRQEIPDEWWSYDWDKIIELEDFLAKGYKRPELYAQAQYFLAFNYRMKGDSKKALELYTHLIAAYPEIKLECAKAQFEIGQIYRFDIVDLPKAIGAYKELIANYSESFLCPLGQVAIARCYRQQKDHATALIECQKVIDDYPEAKNQHLEAYMDMGDISMEQKDIEKAIFYYKNAYMSCPSDYTDSLKWIVDILYTALRARGDSPESAEQFIASLSAEKEKEESSTETDRATLKQSIDSLKNKLTVTFNPKEREKIISQLIEEYEAMLKMALYTDFEINQAKEEMVLLKLELNKEGEALELAQEVLQEYPGSPKASEVVGGIVLMRASKLTDEGKFDEAIAEYREFADSNVSELYKVMAKNLIAFNYVKKGQSKEAIETYESIIEEHPNLYEWCANAQYQIGRCYEEIEKNPLKARAAYQKLIEEYPQDYWVKSAKERLKELP